MRFRKKNAKQIQKSNLRSKKRAPYAFSPLKASRFKETPISANAATYQQTKLNTG
jgi:hypothetical protein